MNDSQRMRRRKRQLLLKVIAGGFIMLLLMRVDLGQWLGIWRDGAPNRDSFSVVGSNRQGQGHSFLRRMMEGQFKQPVTPGCDIPYLKSAARVVVDESLDCVRRPPSPSSCQLAQDLFVNPSDYDLDTVCPPGKHYCSTQVRGGSWTVNCSRLGCKKPFFLGTVDLDTGQYIWAPFKTTSDLELAIIALGNHSNSGYCLVQCGPDVNRQDVNKYKTPPHYHAAQIVNLHSFVKNNPTNRLPSGSKQTVKPISTMKNYLNFNFIFIDSVSRHHFFRSLPKSIKQLESLSESSLHSEKPVILDFELVQGVRSRTFETLQALFSGLINPFEKPFGTQAMPRVALQTETLLRPLKVSGYRTLWMEDLCVWWEWGISKDLLVHDKNLTTTEAWVKLQHAFKNAGIDSIGNSLSSCRILHSNHHPDPFHGPENLCYNGQHQHKYQFDYLKLFQESLEHSSEPFFTFLETNIGHEDTGLRIQYLDKDLSEYLEFASGLEDTLTVLFSDHGNAYGQYVSHSDEGKLEMYHPFLFMIVPNRVKKWIGQTQMAALLRNQKKLISVLDLHYTLTALIELVQTRKPIMLLNGTDVNPGEIHHSRVSEFNSQFSVTKAGLLEDISSSRTCSHIPRIMPNLCICQNYDIETQTLAYHFIIAQFIVGEINNEIQLQRANWGNMSIKERRRSIGGFGSCYRLAIDHIKNVRQSAISDDVHSVKMDLFVKGAPHLQPELFFASVTIHSLSTDAIQLDSFDRITPYSHFSSCADRGVELKLCVCNRTENIQSRNPGNLSNIPTDSTGERTKHLYKSRQTDVIFKDSSLTTNITEVSVHGNKCLFVMSHSNEAGVSVTAVNDCRMTVQITLEMVTRNLMLSSSGMVEKMLYPRDVTFLSIGVLSDPDQPWSWGMSISYTLR